MDSFFAALRNIACSCAEFAITLDYFYISTCLWFFLFLANCSTFYIHVPRKRNAFAFRLEIDIRFDSNKSCDSRKFYYSA